MAKTPQIAFEISKNVAIPPRTKDVPEYGVPFDKMKKGDSILIPNAVPKEHARLLLGRYGRENDIDFVTRTEKNAKGEITGIRVWHNGPRPAKEEKDAATE